MDSLRLVGTGCLRLLTTGGQLVKVYESEPVDSLRLVGTGCLRLLITGGQLVQM